jgi:hypothetical protein
MKKQLTLGALYIITGLLLASCGTHMSLTKRHYNKGYYIAHATSVQPPHQAQEKKNEVAKAMPSLHALRTVTRENSLNGYTPQQPAFDDEVIASSKNRVAPTPGQPAKQIQKKRTLLRELPAIQRPIAQVRKTVSATDREGLSLFWLIILIILILWAIGFLAGGFGLGGLINLLLLVALILLILWLLRIV